MDTDVIMDFFMDQEPYSALAAKLFTYAEKREIEVFVSALSFSNLYYVARKFVGKKNTLVLLKNLEKIVTILTVDEQIIKNALLSDYKDFEDSIQDYTARQLKDIKTIVTRNVRDYSKSPLAIHTPDSYLKLLEQKK